MPRILPSNIKVPTTIPVPGFRHFLTPLRKLIFDYDPYQLRHEGIRTYIKSHLVSMAKANPEVEVVVRKTKRGEAALLRGHYVNGRDKVICVNRLEHNQVAQKVDLLLNSSGAKMKHIRRIQVEAAPGGEAARGIWSAIHDQARPNGGYRL
ncbi:hypothetical protein BCR39DRAFT_519897 [Naematelia encephala]|uniref:Large ribosomal subunit protein mL43 n=1 Tax=Naematelia encephala TaxID=71784 RepID=A0A1Y2BF00_9TREE|nr:hypothetical protein BCR39DRAFT_519897 [Naematelia encephala]